MLIERKQSLLLIVDIQEKLAPAIHEGAAAIAPPALAARCGCANHGRRLFTGLLLAGAAAPALAAIPECRRARAAQLVPAERVEQAVQKLQAAMPN